jgi:hypothetical protein
MHPCRRSCKHQGRSSSEFLSHIVQSSLFCHNVYFKYIFVLHFSRQAYILLGYFSTLLEPTNLGCLILAGKNSLLTILS